MKGFHKVFYSHRTRLSLSVILIATILAIVLSTNQASANHPVLVEGNCDSPVPGTTLVAPGTCGDFDGDGRIGTAEDTDGADRIFGTLKAALGPGTGAAAGTGANNNGSIVIVKSGRFAEVLVIGEISITDPSQGTATPGNVTIEAAPGVEADIDAVLQGDPSGGNTFRQAAVGIMVNYPTVNRRVILRNLTISNFSTGVAALGIARVTMENCRVENNLNYGIRVQGDSRLAVFQTRVSSTGFRIGGNNAPGPGDSISFEGTSAGTVYHSHITGSSGAAIANSGSGTVFYYELFLGNNLAGFVNTGAGAISRNSVP